MSSSVPLHSNVPHAPRPHNSVQSTGGVGSVPPSRKKGGRKYVASTSHGTSSHSALPSSTKAAHTTSSSYSNQQATGGEAIPSDPAEDLASTQRMLDVLAKERSFMMNLLDQAKQERQELIESIAQRDATIQRKDAEIAKLAQRFKAEEQAFRETLAMELDRMEEQRVQDGRHGRRRDQLLVESVEVLVAAEVFSAVSGGYIKHILKIIQAIPTTRAAAEDACNRFISGQDTTSSQKQHASHVLNMIIAECSAFAANKLKKDTARQRGVRKAKKGNRTSQPATLGAGHGAGEDSLDEGDEVGTNSMSLESPVYAYTSNMTVGPPHPAVPPFYEASMTSNPHVATSPTNRNSGLISNLMNVMSAGRYFINSSNSKGGADLASDGEGSAYSKLLEETPDANYTYPRPHASPKSDSANKGASPTSSTSGGPTTSIGFPKQVSFNEPISVRDGNRYSNISVNNNGKSASNPLDASYGRLVEPSYSNTTTDSPRSLDRNSTGFPDHSDPSPSSSSVCGPDPMMNSCFPMFSSRSLAHSTGPKTSIVSTNYRSPRPGALVGDHVEGSVGSVTLESEDYCISDASSDSSVTSNKSATKPTKELWRKNG